MLFDKSGRRHQGLEAAPTLDPAFDAAMILFETIVKVNAGPVLHHSSQHGADRSGIGAMAIRRYPVAAKARGCPAERKNAFAALMSRCSLS